ncbi:hypothetical protein F2Q69_00007710 [Brassica cretica]|uniref:asparagine synthase (glutamine-hydrolyzing) n=2 Tax=Brassica TaxID=3705 RepID=A0A8S9P195_BRACR|nr:hypothetical protein F2Q69_00007710 [Brassica cretica]
MAASSSNKNQVTDRSKKVNSIDTQKIDELTTKVDQLLKNNQGKSSSWKKLHRAIQKAAPETERQQRISRSEIQEKIKALFTEALTLSLKVIIDKLDIMDVEPLQLTLVFVNSSASVPYSSIRDLPNGFNYLAHQRLAIIDPDSGDQPLFNEDKSIVVTVNGEIYNHEELRKGLKNHKFHTGSDCDVIAHLYEEHGENFVDMLDGIFSFVLLDTRDNSFMVARDAKKYFGYRLRHRGPDWSGIYQNGFNYLAHQRLAIIDPDSGDQPLFNEDKSIVVTVNGEIYNHEELRKGLKNHKFHTGSDCDVIAHLYEEHGENFVDMLDGIFSFVLLDTRDNSFMVARDAVGVTSLYIGWGLDGSLWVSSEMKGLHEDCEHFEAFPPGHLYSSKSGGGFKQWYNPPWFNESVPSTPYEPLAIRSAFEDVRKLFFFFFFLAVIKRLMTDVPFGVLLSGGLDSSLVASITARHLAGTKAAKRWGPQLHSFCVGLEGSPDLKAGKEVAEYLGTVHHEFHFTVQDGIDAIEDVIYHVETYDVTTIRASTPMFLMSRKIKSLGVKMVLSGEGSDEIFGGYLYFHKAPNKQEFHQETCRKAVIKRLMTDVPFGVLLSGGLDSSLVASITARHLAGTKAAKRWGPQLHSFCVGLEGSPDLKAGKEVAEYLGTVHHEFHFTVQDGIDAIEDVIYHVETYDVTTIRASTPMFLMSRKIKSLGVKMVLSGEGSDEIFGGYLYFHKAPNKQEFHQETCRKIKALHKYDCLRANKATSAFGLEARVPFLDKEFINTAMSLDPESKMIKPEEGRIEKWVLRRAFDDEERPYLPKHILYRQKEQFSDGVGYSWIDGLKAHAAENVNDKMMSNAAFIFPHNTPLTKEAYYYRMIFERFFPQNSARLTVPGGATVACSTAKAVEWDASWSNNMDPSGRAAIGVHLSAYDGSKVALPLPTPHKAIDDIPMMMGQEVVIQT